MISNNTKCLMMLSLTLMSACSDGGGGNVGSADGGGTDAALGTGPEGGSQMDAGLAADSGFKKDAASTGGSGGSAGGSGGAGGQGGPLLRTTVPGDRIADQLTPTELTQVCKDLSVGLEAFEKMLEPKFCNLAGIIAYSVGDRSQATCEEAVKSCLAAPKEPSEESCEALTGCKATLAEVLACSNDQITATNAFFDKLPTCSQLTVGGGDAPGDGEGPPVPASCKAIEAKCPSITVPEM